MTTTQTETTFNVYIFRVDGEALTGEDRQTVNAPDEWKARTRAMMVTPLIFRGEEAQYAVVPKDEDDGYAADVARAKAEGYDWS
jgi:hypothetical protein